MLERKSYVDHIKEIPELYVPHVVSGAMSCGERSWDYLRYLDQLGHISNFRSLLHLRGLPILT